MAISAGDRTAIDTVISDITTKASAILGKQTKANPIISRDYMMYLVDCILLMKKLVDDLEARIAVLEAR